MRRRAHARAAQSGSGEAEKATSEDLPAVGGGDDSEDGAWVTSVIRWGFLVIEVVIFSVVLFGVGYAFFSEAASREKQGGTNGACNSPEGAAAARTESPALCAARWQADSATLVTPADWSSCCGVADEHLLVSRSAPLTHLRRSQRLLLTACASHPARTARTELRRL